MRLGFKGIVIGALLTASGAAYACADGGCDGGFNLLGQSYSCQGRAMLAPGNDSRINLMFLLSDRGGRASAGLSATARPDMYNDLGTVFIDWRTLRGAMFPSAIDTVAETGSSAGYSGSRCMNFADATAALNSAMQANRSLPAAERSQLVAARAEAEAVCKQGAAPERNYGERSKLPALTGYGAWPVVTSPAGREFLGYMQAADAFYAERWDDARRGFAGLFSARDPWVRETAAYTLARVEFAAAQAAAFGDYGNYGAEKVDQAAARRGLAALNAYLKAWPKGRYADSAQGLQRRGYWLSADYAALGGNYARLLDTVSPQTEAAAAVVEEIDTKLLFDAGAKDIATQGPLLLATQDLIAMRADSDSANGAPALSAAALDAQAPRFAARPDLFSYLQATHAFYFAQDYRRVLQLIPDKARQGSFSNLDFSRQVLRGMALAALDDRNEAGFWQELLPGAKGQWQRPLVELGLAMNWERKGRIEEVFAAGSPITDPTIHNTLITYSAGPALLRRIVQSPALPSGERDQALYTLLANQLIRGQFASFASDTKLPLSNSKANAHVFTTGKMGDDYPCAPIAVTARALAKDPADVAGRLCLGDFFRINGLDYMNGPYDPNPAANELGGSARGFTGPRLFRSDIYPSVAANSAAKPNDRAYALYRAVMCYAPSAINDCGGKDVPLAQRKAWYNQLKSAYPQSAWAKKLRYYW